MKNPNTRQRRKRRLQRRRRSLRRQRRNQHAHDWRVETGIIFEFKMATTNAGNAMGQMHQAISYMAQNYGKSLHQLGNAIDLGRLKASPPNMALPPPGDPYRWDEPSRPEDRHIDNDTAPDVIGYQRGYRLFRVKVDGYEAPSREVINWGSSRFSSLPEMELKPHFSLGSIGKEYVWYGIADEAVCRASVYHTNPPQVDCGCGLWATYSIAPLTRRFSLASYLITQVKAWGKIVGHRYGFRSEFMEVEGVILTTNHLTLLGQEEFPPFDFNKVDPGVKGIIEQYDLPYVVTENPDQLFSLPNYRP